GGVGPRGAHDADVVDRSVLVVAAVLDRHRRLREPRRHLRERHRDAVVIGRDRAEQRAVARVDERVLADLDRPQRVEVAADSERGPRAEAEHEEQCDDRCAERTENQARAPPAPEPRRALSLSAALGEDEVEIVEAAAARAQEAVPPASRPASAMRRSLAARSAAASPGIHLRTTMVALSPESSVTYTSSPSALILARVCSRFATGTWTDASASVSELRIVEFLIVSDASFSFGTTSRSLSRVRSQV